MIIFTNYLIRHILEVKEYLVIKEKYLTGALSEEPEKKPASVPAIYIVKYNRFVDNILEKMNDILRKSYDPVNVKLQPIDASKKTTKKKGSKNKSKR